MRAVLGQRIHQDLSVAIVHRGGQYRVAERKPEVCGGTIEHRALSGIMRPRRDHLHPEGRAKNGSVHPEVTRCQRSQALGEEG